MGSRGDLLVYTEGRAGDLNRDAVDREALGDRVGVVKCRRDVERERVHARRAPAQLAFQAVAPEQSAAENPVAAHGEVVAPLVERLRDMDPAFAERIRGLVSGAVQLLAVRDRGPPGRPEAAVENAAQPRPLFGVLDAPDLPADDRLSRLGGDVHWGSYSHEISRYQQDIVKSSRRWDSNPRPSRGEWQAPKSGAPEKDRRPVDTRDHARPPRRGLRCSPAFWRKHAVRPRYRRRRRTPKGAMQDWASS